MQQLEMHRDRLINHTSKTSHTVCSSHSLLVYVCAGVCVCVCVCVRVRVRVRVCVCVCSPMKLV